MNSLFELCMIAFISENIILNNDTYDWKMIVLEK